ARGRPAPRRRRAVAARRRPRPRWRGPRCARRSRAGARCAGSTGARCRTPAAGRPGTPSRPDPTSSGDMTVSMSNLRCATFVWMAAVVACSKATPPAAETPAAGDGPVVRLLEPGAEPRRQLRFKVKPGDRQQLTMHMKMAMELNSAQKVDMPTMNLGMEVTIDDVAANGDLGYSFRFSDVGVADDGGTPGVAEAMGGMLK